MVLTALLPRQTLQGETTTDPEFMNDRDGRFWYSRVRWCLALYCGLCDGELIVLQTGQIVRWSIFFGLFVLFMLYMIIGYWHAKRRIAKGLPPLAYHRVRIRKQSRPNWY
jgi:hypothetical protein